MDRYDFAEVRERHAFRAQRVSGAESEARCGTKIRELQFGQAPLFGSLQGEARSVGVPGGSRTHGLSLRRRTLYPTELRKQICDKIILHRRGDCNKNSERITDFWRSVGDAVLAATGNAIGIKTRMFSDGERRTQKNAFESRLRLQARQSLRYLRHVFGKRGSFIVVGMFRRRKEAGSIAIILPKSPYSVHSLAIATDRKRMYNRRRRKL